MDTSLAPGVFTGSDRRLGRTRVSATEAIVRSRAQQAQILQTVGKPEECRGLAIGLSLLTMDGDPDRIRTCDPQIRNLMLDFDLVS